MEESKYGRFKVVDENINQILSSEFFMFPGLTNDVDKNGFVIVEIDAFKIALKQLYNDGYLKEIKPNCGKFYLSGEGRDFLLRGGYKAKFEREQKLRDISDKKAELDLTNAIRVNKHYKRNQWIMWITFAISIILSVLKLAEVLKIWPYHK